MSFKDNKLKYIFSVGAVVLVAVLGSIFVNIGMDWFNALTKPSQWIPNFVIPLVWTVVYILAIYVLVKFLNAGGINKYLQILFILNGIFNVLWCLIFFTLNLTFLGNIVIVINAVLATLLVVEILRQNKVLGFILSIYPVWLYIATTLNLAMWILNWLL